MIKLATVFSGIGSIEQALKLKQIPYDIVFACDYDQHVKESYFANYDITEDKWFNDVKDLEGTPFKDQVDLFVYGSPCQSFSVSGKRLGLEDARGTLFYEGTRLIKEMEPKMFIYENVKGLLHHDKGKTWEIMRSIFDDLGYNLHSRILNARDFGIPQNRERIFVIGFKQPKDFNFPEPIPLVTSMMDMLEENVPDKYYLSDKMIAYVSATGTKGFHLPPVFNSKVAKTIVATVFKMHRAGIDNYIKNEHGTRRLTPRECLRLMGYPEDFKQVVSDTQMYKQAGNSIVVNVFTHLIDELIKVEAI